MRNETLDSIKKSRSKSINNIQAIIYFTIAMLLIRAIVIGIIHTNTNTGFLELYFSRFYYGDTDISMYDFWDKGPLYQLLPGGIWNFILFPVVLIFGVLELILIPVTYVLIRVVTTIDILAPQSGNVVLWWILFSLFGAVILNKLSKHWFSSIIVVLIAGTVLVSPVTKMYSPSAMQGTVKHYNIKEFFILQGNLNEAKSKEVSLEQGNNANSANNQNESKEKQVPYDGNSKLSGFIAKGALLLFVFIIIKFSKKTVFFPDGTQKTYIRKSIVPLIAIAIFLLIANIQHSISQTGDSVFAGIKHNILSQLMQLGDSLAVLLIALGGLAYMAFKRGTSKEIIRWLAYAFLIFIFFVGIASGF